MNPAYINQAAARHFLSLPTHKLYYELRGLQRSQRLLMCQGKLLLGILCQGLANEPGSLANSQHQYNHGVSLLLELLLVSCHLTLLHSRGIHI